MIRARLKRGRSDPRGDLLVVLSIVQLQTDKRGREKDIFRGSARHGEEAGIVEVNKTFIKLKMDPSFSSEASGASCYIRHATPLRS